MQVQAVCETEGELVKLPPPLQKDSGRFREKLRYSSNSILTEKPSAIPLFQDFVAKASNPQQHLLREQSSGSTSPPG